MVNVVGLFDTEGQAQNAIRALSEAGFAQSELSIAARDRAVADRVRTDDNHATMTGEMAFKGAEGGAVVGGILGLLAGLGAIAIPGLGMLIAGPLAGLALGATTGAVAGGLIGALVGLGIPEDDAHVYAESVRRGSILVNVHTDDARAELAEEIMEDHGAIDVDERRAALQQGGFTRFDPAAPAVVEETVASAPAVTPVGPRVRRYVGDSTIEQQVVMPATDAWTDEVYRTHYATNYQPSGAPYEEVLPAYQYGHQVASLPTYQGRQWVEVETEIRPQWEQTYPDTWETRRAAIQAAYEAARARSNRATVL